MRTPAKLAMTAAVLVGVSAVATGGGTYAAFSTTTENAGNTFNAGTLTLTDNDTGSAMFNVPAMKPGDSYQTCIRVTSGGTLPSTVKLHATSTAGSTLDSYLNLQVERGTQGVTPFVTEPNADPNTAAEGCTGFTAPTALYAGGLTGFTAAANITDAGTGASAPKWAAGEFHSYRFTISMPAAVDNAAQDAKATTTFHWTATS